MGESSALLEQQPAPNFLVPIAKPAQVIEVQEKTKEYIKSVLKDGRDYGVIQGTERATLFKAGAEAVLAGFGCVAEHSIVTQEVDHDRENVFIDRYNNKKQSVGLYRYVVQTRIVHRTTGELVGTGMGACSTMESKYIWKPRDAENTALKMAQKRALVDAVLSTFGLSDRFTQDVDELSPNEKPVAQDPGKEEKRAAADYAQTIGITAEELAELISHCKELEVPTYQWLLMLKAFGCRNKGIALLDKLLFANFQTTERYEAPKTTTEPESPPAPASVEISEEILGMGIDALADGYYAIQRELGWPDPQIQATVVASVWRKWIGRAIPNVTETDKEDWQRLYAHAVAIKEGREETPKAFQTWMTKQKEANPPNGS